VTTSVDKKRNLGLLSPEEEAALQAQIDMESEQRLEWSLRTRRTNKQENKKTKLMCEALTKMENAKKRPDLEGELPDMPQGEADEDFEEG